MKRVATQNKIGENGYSIQTKRIDGSHSTHSHAFYELEYIRSGRGEYVIDGESYPILAGMLFLMTPLNFHCVTAEDCEVYHLVFSEQVCQSESLSGFLARGDGIALQAEGSDRELLECVLRELDTHAQDPLYAADLLNVLLGKLLALRDCRREKTTPVSRGHLYLLNHFRENPSLSAVADYAGYTPTYFSTMFKQETGMTFKQYLDNLRFAYAANLSRHTALSMQEICRESGFEDYPNFLRRFKARFGVAPTAYRTSKKE